MKYFSIALLIFSINLSAGCTLKPKPENMLHYLVREPLVKSSTPPLVLLMHGYGSNEADLFSFANLLPKNFLVVSVRGPYTISENSYMWYQADFTKETPIINKEQAESSRQEILHFITQLKTKYAFDEKQVYLVGFSQGAIMAYSLGLTEPKQFKGIAAMSGRILNEIKPMVASKEKLKGLNVFISHGTNDLVIKINHARDSKTFLESQSIHQTYKEYREGHTISQEMITDLNTWLGLK